MILSAIGSPVAVGGDKVTITDLLVAVRVCGLTYGQSDIRPKIKDAWWKRKLSKDLALFRSETEKFYEWMAKQCSPPKFHRPGAMGTHKGIERGPRCLGLACSLMSRGGIPEADAWNYSLGRAMWMDAQLAQLSGIDLRFLDDADLDESEIDLSTLTDDQAMAQFQSELPEDLIGPTFEYWRASIKRKDGTQ